MTPKSRHGINPFGGEMLALVRMQANSHRPVVDIDVNDFKVKISAIDHIGANGIHSVSNAEGKASLSKWTNFFREKSVQQKKKYLRRQKQ